MAPLVLWLALLLICSLFGAVSPQADANGMTPCGCQVCAISGDCAHAYRREPGQFCGNWLDRANQRQPCCCPNDAVCKTSNYACNCGYSPSHGGDGALPGPMWLRLLLPVLIVAVVLCCSGCCTYMDERAEARESDRIPMAASAPPTYGGNGRREMGAGTGAALGGTAGLLGGVLLGETLAHTGRSHHGYGGGFGGGGGGGGGTFAGDF